MGRARQGFVHTHFLKASFRARTFTLSIFINAYGWLQVYGNSPVSFVVPVKDHEGQQFMIGRGRDLCRLNWNTAQIQKQEEITDGQELPLHW